MTRPVFTFYTDAAGLHLNTNELACERSAVCLGVINNHVWWWSQLDWNELFLMKTKDNKGQYYGHRSDVLETISIFLPFLCIPATISNSTVIFYVDNQSVVKMFYQPSKRNYITMNLINTLKILSKILNVNLKIVFKPRMSNTWLKLADHLSRKSSTTRFDIDQVKHAVKSMYSGHLLEWFSKPNNIYNLCQIILTEIVMQYTWYIIFVY